jgi:phosphoadenosine phosphosulfate reductase
MTLRDRIEEARATVADALAGGGPACVTSSFQNEDMVVTRLVRELRPDVPVLFLDTGYHFAETYAYRDRMAAEWGLNLVNLLPRQTVAEQESELGILYESAPDRCCGMRKVEPLFRAVAEFEVWFTGLRREQSPTRANLQAVDGFRLPSGKELQKVSPLAMWTNREVWAYLKEHGIPMLPLYEQGYTSIGCEPCTTRPATAEDLRSGRWGGKKLECGIHIAAPLRGGIAPPAQGQGGSGEAARSQRR